MIRVSVGGAKVLLYIRNGHSNNMLATNNYAMYSETQLQGCL